jgi:hypothetical protein
MSLPPEQSGFRLALRLAGMTRITDGSLHSISGTATALEFTTLLILSTLVGGSPG